MSTFRSAAVVFLSAALGVCGDPEIREQQVRVDLVPSTGTCGYTLEDYDTVCVAALKLSVFDDAEVEVASQCTPTASRYDNVRELSTSAEVLALLSGVRPMKSARFAFFGYHSFDRKACGSQTDQDLMIWGTSGRVDLTDPDRAEITIPVECRPDCDCGAFPTDECPEALPVGACMPGPTASCQRACEGDDDCFEGLLACDRGTGQCAVTSDGPCAECSSDGDCQSGLCVHDSAKDIRICAVRCPPAGPLPHRCPKLWSCKRLGGDFTRTP